MLILEQKSAAGVVLTRVRKAQTVRVSRRWSRNGNLQSGEALVANDDSNLRPARAQLAEPPYADPPVRSCGGGEWVTTPPMPISGCELTGIARHPAAR